MNTTTNKYTYGPVPSRRLGYSLGIDIIPYKNCSFNCVYCQLGKTTNITTERKEYTPVKDVISDIKIAAAVDRRVDYFTFSGSGEPTLHAGIKTLIHETKRLTPVPIAVLTNSSLMNQKSVQTDLLEADLILPTLCAVTETVFERVNRPHKDISIRSIIQALIDFRKSYTGNIWLEIMLVKGINDQKEELEKLRRAADMIEPDKIHINTVIRPPSERSALPLSIDELERARSILGDKAEIIVDFKKDLAPERFTDTQSQVMNTIRRRPVTLKDIESITGLNKHEIIKHIDYLLKNKEIEIIRHDDRDYYKALSKEVK
jgi:wyosine [tRNA(Phe)-imidazoG37] synthetase (radical SAM superfamily)